MKKVEKFAVFNQGLNTAEMSMIKGGLYDIPSVTILGRNYRNFTGNHGGSSLVGVTVTNSATGDFLYMTTSLDGGPSQIKSF